MEIKTIYVARDGKEFTKELECCNYEKSLESPVLMFTYNGKQTDRITNANVVYVKSNATRKQLLKLYDETRKIVGSNAIKYSFLLLPVISNTFFFWMGRGFERIDINTAAIVTNAVTAICDKNEMSSEGLDAVASNVKDVVEREDVSCDYAVLSTFTSPEEDEEVFEDYEEEDLFEDEDEDCGSCYEDEDENCGDGYEEPEDPDYSDYGDDQESEDEFWARIARMNYGNKN